MRRLSLDQLHAVVEVVQLGSFSAAARSLNLTQPAVSLQVRELEQRLGVQLVERLGKRAYATAARTGSSVKSTMRSTRCAGAVTVGSLVFASAPEARYSPTCCRPSCARCVESIPISRS